MTYITVAQVNYGTPDLVIKGLRSISLERKFFPNMSVIVIDNCSLDDSVEIISQAILEYGWKDWISLHVSKANYGFAYGNNLAIGLSKSRGTKVEYYWLLNPDARPRPGATSSLVSELKESPNSIVGSRLEDEDGARQLSTFRFPSLVTELSSGFKLGLLDMIFRKGLVNVDEAKPEWMAGASLMFSAETQERIGLMDEEYFLYYEEVDYLRKAKVLGIDCVFVPQSRVVHSVGASTGISDDRKAQPRRPAYWFQSRRRYFIKNHSLFYLINADMLWMFGYAVWLFRKWLIGSDELAKQPPYFFRDFFRHSSLNFKNWFSMVFR